MIVVRTKSILNFSTTLKIINDTFSLQTFTINIRPYLDDWNMNNEYTNINLAYVILFQ